MIDFLIANRLLPESFLRSQIRRRLGARILEETNPEEASDSARIDGFAGELNTMPIEPIPPEQGDEYPVHSLEIARLVRGPHLLSSCCWFEHGDETLEKGEVAMMRLQSIRAQFDNGQEVLHVGAEYGGLSTWLGNRYPQMRITAICRYATEADYIAKHAAAHSLENVTAFSADLNTFDACPGRFDRVVAIESMENLRNWPAMLERIARWLKPNGMCFLQIRTHRRLSYSLQKHPSQDWLERRLPAHGLMPSEDLLGRFNKSLEITQRWRIDGTHYRRTAQLWGENLESNHAEIRAAITAAQGTAGTTRTLAALRLQFLLAEERGGYANGSEWNATQYALRRAG